mgnify:CR=1 FL=1
MSRAFVFVHGAWHGGWLWRRSAELLRRDGHEAFTPSLTGLGDRSHLLAPGINLSTHVEDIVRVIETFELNNVVLCGHSYGGLVVGQVADQLPDRIGKIVFVDAFLPEDGMNVLDLSEGHGVREAIIDAARDHGEGWFVPPPPAEQFEMHRDEDTQLVRRLLTPQPMATFTEPARVTGKWREGRRLSFVRATGLKTPMKQLWEKAVADENVECHELKCGHNIMLDLPQDLHEILVS